jgi:hypothetical protein
MRTLSAGDYFIVDQLQHYIPSAKINEFPRRCLLKLIKDDASSGAVKERPWLEAIAFPSFNIVFLRTLKYLRDYLYFTLLHEVGHGSWQSSTHKVVAGGAYLCPLIFGLVFGFLTNSVVVGIIILCCYLLEAMASVSVGIFGSEIDSDLFAVKALLRSEPIPVVRNILKIVRSIYQRQEDAATHPDELPVRMQKAVLSQHVTTLDQVNGVHLLMGSVSPAGKLWVIGNLFMILGLCTSVLLFHSTSVSGTIFALCLAIMLYLIIKIKVRRLCTTAEEASAQIRTKIRVTN